MLRVIGWITRDHDPGMLGLACIVCVLATFIGMRLQTDPCDQDASPRPMRLAASVAALAIGLSTAEFIALLALRPEIAAGFAVPFCLMSLTLATAAAAAIVIGGRRGARVPAILLCGLLAGGCAALMHVAAMRSLPMPYTAHYDWLYYGAGTVLGSAAATAAMAYLAQRSRSLAAASLALAVLTIHLAATGAVTLAPSASHDPTHFVVSRSVLALAAGSGGLVIVLLALGGSVLDQHSIARMATDARRLRRLADATYEGLIFERAGRVTDTNRAMCALAGQEQQALIGTLVSGLIKGITLRSVPGELGEHELLRPDGTVRMVEVLLKNGPDGGHIIAVRARDRNERGQLQKRAQSDALTGLINRDNFEQLLQKAIAQSDRTGGLALLYIDIDRFESVYEAYGARASDDALIQIARRLSQIVRASDTVARLGRDEFAVVQLVSESSGDATALAQRIVTELALPIEADGHCITLTASVGVALYPANGATADSLIRNAAMAMRRSKREGRATWRYFEPEIDLRMRDKRHMEAELRKALADNEFSVHYQAFYCAETLQVAGCEALLRWNHPTRGRVSPADFIPVAEENGTIVPIGNWVLRIACEQAAAWDQSVTIAVNLSPAQFSHQGLVGHVADVLRQTGLPPERLELEITEGTLMADTVHALRILKALKALGVKVAMDDFGTGYSSLSYLRKFPFDKIKIDRSFISDADDGVEAESIVEAIIAMGQSLRLEITAEGVETNRQLAMLRSKGCTFVQGFLLAKPCEADQLDLSASKPRWLQPVGSAATPARLAAVPAIAQSL